MYENPSYYPCQLLVCPLFFILVILVGSVLAYHFCLSLLLPGGSHGKESACSVGDPDSIPVLGRSSGEGNGNSLGYSCLENPMAEGTSEATVCGVAKSQTRLSNFNFTFTEFSRLVVSDSL